MSPLLTLEHIDKSFGGVDALRDVSFELGAGEVHALVGENGAGKSTLVRLITGALVPDAGTIALEGRRLELRDPQHARRLGISAIYQQPALFPDLSVAENITFGLIRGTPWRRIRWRERVAQARTLLDEFGARIDPRAEVGQLSMPDQQLVEIARALVGDVRILILDEPTASLSEAEITRLFTAAERLRSRGVGLIYISHRLDELPRIANRVTVLRDGRRITTLPIAQATRTELVRCMVGRELFEMYPPAASAAGDVVLRVEGLSSRAAGLGDVSLEVRAGEIVGLAGLVGAGRTGLARALFGLESIEEGTTVLNGHTGRCEAPSQAKRLGIAYVPEDRRRHGVIAELSVTANVSLAVLKSQARRGMIDFDGERRLAGGFVDRLSIKTASLDAPVALLSGGNQQKVALARWLATRPALLILDEPTQGVDIGARAEIHRLMRELAAQGLAVLMISSDLPEILGMSDRVIVMHGGRIAGELRGQEATPERIMHLALGAPPAREAAP